mmetsp:Transcript_28797/g.73938  ORF Transcript_28797/g.73938 Transcript_28797/m.73938 type:complete len:450 (+) Transcript_28797:780-2129(+)
MQHHLRPQRHSEHHLYHQQQQQQQQHSRQLRALSAQSAPWGQRFAQGALAVLSAAALAGAVDVRGAFAENELAELAASKSTSELVKPGCFATECKGEVEACGSDGDCVKGLACSAKCMGDAQCTMGCFARYGNPTLDKVLQCTIEDAGCIQIATQEPGADTAFDAPRAPKALVKATPASMSGKWYKVLGFNPNYDCFDCQKNSFTAGAEGGKRPSAASDVVAMNIGPQSAIVDVEYTMPRDRGGAVPETFHAKLTESLEFDTQPGAVRTAHTEGHMFGLTFWENWYLIGQNQPKEPEFRFVYYTGKTLQNRYEGAFVYARKPELPSAAMPAVYKLAREAGMDPTRACYIDNACFAAPVEAPTAQPPLFTPVASADTLEPAASGATAAAAPSMQLPDVFQPMRSSLRDIRELLEDPKPFGEAIFAKQRHMYDVREYDANGYRLPSANLAP